MKAFVLQMNSKPDVEANLTYVEQQLQSYVEPLAGSIVVLPECFAYFGGKDGANLDIAESCVTQPSDAQPVQSRLAQLAKTFKIYLVAGSFPIKSERDDKFKPTCLVYSPAGKLLCHYQKIHLFDVTVADKTGSYQESLTSEPGQELVCFDTEFGKVGVAICYDLRFPGLFQTLTQMGAQIIVLPSAFTEKTGKSHWLPLLQARAIENQVYMIGSNQSGIHANHRETYGHSVIISPWGEVLVNAKDELGLFGTSLDKSQLEQIRQAMPVLAHNKFNCNFIQ